MIKLKNILNELTTQGLQIPDQKGERQTTMALMNAGIPVALGDHKAALKRLTGFKGGKMFLHVQYHYIEGKDGKIYFIHQTQYYVTGHEVNCTQLFMQEVLDVDPAVGFKKSKSYKKKEIGRILVPTDKFLKGLKRVKVLARAS